MTTFWALAGLLLALTLALLVWPLLRPSARVATASPGLNQAVLRDQLREAERDLAADVISKERFEELKTELEARVLEDSTGYTAVTPQRQPARKTALVLALAIPLASVMAYRALGQPEAMNPAPAAQVEQDATELAKQMEGAVAQLAQKLKEKPDNPVGWHMLGRSYLLLQKPPEAAAALRKAAELAPANPDVWADLADALGMVQGATLAGEPTQLIQKALALKPDHGKALALAGSAEFEAGRFAQARAQWEKLLATVPPESEAAQGVRASIAQARAKEGTGAAPEQAGATANAPALSGEVSLSPALAAKAQPQDTVFIFARAAQGPRMPLAVLKRRVADLPVKFSLDDTLAMQPNMKLSGFEQVVVGVRVSASGSATAQSGDLVGQSAPVSSNAKGVRVVIDQITP
jgi:cytochrome c-type biogenesis protein CcmH